MPQLILLYLRELQLSPTAEEVPLPTVPAPKKSYYDHLVDYLGLAHVLAFPRTWEGNVVATPRAGGGAVATGGGGAAGRDTHGARSSSGSGGCGSSCSSSSSSSSSSYSSEAISLVNAPFQVMVVVMTSLGPDWTARGTFSRGLLLLFSANCNNRFKTGLQLAPYSQVSHCFC